VNMRERKAHSMYKVGSTASGNILVEITPSEWERLAQYKEIPENVGEVLRKYRKGQGLSQEALATQLGVHRNWISAIENGQSRNTQLVEKYRRIMAIINL
jgi:ribosome-binding protein aMBF1 (putative translation factor)